MSYVYFFPQEKYSLYSKGYKYIQRLPPQIEPRGEQSWWIDIEQTTQGRTEASNTTGDQLSGQKIGSKNKPKVAEITY